ncbi:MAG: leucyl aminopeptidase [Bdellovibrionales bacterium]|jgi:leucyl aminopeptidase|nr:leucyl aminopeptidase [Bdellovibrionales bacterium]
MKIDLNLNAQSHSASELVLVAGYEKTDGDSKKLVNGLWPKEYQAAFNNLMNSKTFTGATGSKFCFSLEDGTTVMAVGLGDKKKLTYEALRKEISTIYSSIKGSYSEAVLDLDGFKVKGNLEKTVYTISESIYLTNYSFDKYLSDTKENKLTKLVLSSKEKKNKTKKLEQSISKAQIVTSSVNFARDLVNEPPNVLNSETYAKIIEKDAKKIKGVKVKVLGKSQLQKENANLFLSVNAGSAYDPKLVHLTYTPSKVTSKTKHIALVGKGLTFDTGGYSLKPSGSMANMKFDMAGSATVYGAFRAIAESGAKAVVTCVLGMTDNAVNEKATMPDSIVKARNGKTVEILNTDAEGRLVLADCLDYTCDLKPDAIIDAATLTGACLVAVGSETCAVLGNNQKLVNSLLKSANNTDEYMWQLPIIPEFHKDIKSPIADLKNIGGSRFGGTAKAAAFLENFIKDDIAWAHLDIAGIGDSQGHLPYCPKKGASGLVVRSLVDYIENA